MMGAEQGGWQARGGVLAALSASKKDVLILTEEWEFPGR